MSDNKILCDICGEEIPEETNDDGIKIRRGISMYNPGNKTDKMFHASCFENASLWRRIRALESRLDNMDSGDMK